MRWSAPAVLDFRAGYHCRVTGYTATTEQLVLTWNRTDPNTGEVGAAKLDVATCNVGQGLRSLPERE
eukprot:5820766-Pyramimonas_sp.AAC.1